MEEKEIWKTIPLPEFNGYYEASTLGRIRSVDRVVEIKSNGKNYKKFLKGKILSNTVSTNGYPVIGVEHKTYKVHRLIALTFIDNIENKPEVSHINGIKTDNRVINLVWVTRCENMTHYRGVLNNVHANRRRLSKEQVQEIMLDNRSLRTIAKDYNVSYQFISLIKNGKTYKDLTENIGK